MTPRKRRSGRPGAIDYDRTSPLAACATELVEELRQLVRPRWHLLEIGPGTGAFTRRIARGLSRVTIVEPSAAMRMEFERLWDVPDIVRPLPCKWEDAPPLDADIVFGANAFYRIPDIAAAIARMNQAARHRVALVQTVGRPHANPMTVETDGQAWEAERADVLCGVLAELGIAYRRRDHEVMRPDGPSRVALVDWVPVAR